MRNQIKSFLYRLKPNFLFDELNRSKLVLKYKALKIGRFCSVQNSILSHNNVISNYVDIINSQVGKYTYIGPNTKIINSKIGSFCSIAADVNINLGKHPVHNAYVSTHPLFYLNRPYNNWNLVEEDQFVEFEQVLIGNDVWIGHGVDIMGGVIIGDGVIVAAGAVVTKNLEPYFIYGGVPAKKISQRFNDQQIESLRKIEWWGKDEKWLRLNHVLMKNLDLLINEMV